MKTLKNHEDYRDLPQGSFYCVDDCTVYEAKKEWDEHIDAVLAESRSVKKIDLREKKW